MILVGQLLGPTHSFHQFSSTRHWTGEVALAGLQPKVSLLREHDRDLRPVGRLVALQDGTDGVWCVFELVDPTFRSLDERKYLSAGFSSDFASAAEGTHITYSDVGLSEVSLVERPAVGHLTECQIDASDLRHGRGGHSWTTTSNHCKVLDRAADWVDHHRAQASAGSDYITVDVGGPIVAKSKRRSVEQ